MAVFKKTVDGVLASFRKAVADLRTIEEQERASATATEQQIVALELDRHAALAEAARAGNIAGKIESLFS
jgi:hypothetical protein